MKRKNSSHSKEEEKTKRRRANAERKNNMAVSPIKIKERRFELLGIFFVLTAILSYFGIFGINAGFVGLYLSDALSYLFGAGALLFASIVFLTGLYFITEHKNYSPNSGFFGFILMFAMLLALYHYIKIPADSESLQDAAGGGLLGGGIIYILRGLFGETGCGVVIFAGLVASVILTTNWSLGKELMNIKDKTTKGLISLKMRSNEKRQITNGENVQETNLYDQEWDDEYISKRAEKISVVEKPIRADDIVEAEVQAEFEEIQEQKPKLHSFWQDLEREEAASKAVQEAIQEAVQNEREMQSSGEVANDNIKEQVEFPLNVEDPENNVADVQNESYPFDTKQTPQIVPPAKRRDSGMGEAGFEVRADAFKSRDNLYEENEDMDLSTPDFSETANSNTFEPIPEKMQNKIENVSKPVKITETQTIGNFYESPKPKVEKPYELPEVTHILSKKVKKENLALKIEIEENAKTLSKTLSDFKVSANIIDACHGPAVTRYELEPAPGVKVSKITGLSEDIALALAATSVRIEPIPGKSAIGIEVPNKELEGVQLREVLERPYFKEAESKLTVGLGMDIGGQAIFADLAKMPHLLIAGSTGSGKSVCVNTLITSILFKAKPDEVKFILIDPKMVELSNYNGIPHLMVPVVTDAKKAASVLNWAVQEMEKRYAKFAEKVVRNMESYNTKFPEDKMGAIVIIIDELADLMMVAPHDVEDAICRLAQKARAAGIHLVLATQRPSVDVITGIIKANIPSRIAFAVSSQIDSRTILDSSGAEKLLGRGDMLFYPIGSPKPQRVQGAFVSDEEVEMLLDFIKGQGVDQEINEEIEIFTEQDTLSDDKGKGRKDEPKTDELLADAVELVVTTGQASTSNVQRRFRVGYARAGRLIDTMETLGIVGPSLGSKPREILMNPDDAMRAVENLQ